MTETDLVEGVATLLRAYSTAPLKSMEVHAGQQFGYEDSAGFVEVSMPRGAEVFEAIGNQAADEVLLSIRAVIPFVDDLANRQKVEQLCNQIRYTLRTNRAISVTSGIATRNKDVRWVYEFSAEGKATFRECTVTVTYRIPQGSTAP